MLSAITATIHTFIKESNIFDQRGDSVISYITVPFEVIGMPKK